MVGGSQDNSETWDAKQYEAALAHLESLQDQVRSRQDNLYSYLHDKPMAKCYANRSRPSVRQFRL